MEELMRERNALLEQLLRLTRQQPEMTDSDTAHEELARWMAKRQQLMDALTKLNDRMPDTLPDDLQPLQADGTALYLQIVQKDRENEQKLKERISDLQEQLRRVKDGKTAFHGYEHTVPDPGATYYDKKQ
ncbi:MAG: hypothetical protein LBI44_05880 [Oscillospiraceae bacterium]|jgi:DNA repair exonuclease SbcCD ATPase subunit|nr:hypothetical protein [Oscillospiraceae bacterium]